MGAVVSGAGHAFPPPMDQAGLWRDHFAARSGDSLRLATKIWENSGIVTRHGAVDPRVEDVSSWGTGARMTRFMREAMPLGSDAVSAALRDADVRAADVGLFVVASCTGYGTPGLDIRLASDLGMSPVVQRLHVGHMGCYAALPALGAATDYVIARGRSAVVLCVELTSLHVQPESQSLQQLVAHALFSDAAAAVVVTPDAGAGWEVLETTAVTDPTSSDQMTWDVTDLGFRMGLSPKVPATLAPVVRPAVTRLLAGHSLTIPHVQHWAVHPGGRRIVEVVGEQLELSGQQLAPSYDILASCGNCSSATVLLVLDQITAAAGEYAVAMAFGPGLTLYATLLRHRS